MQAAHRMHLVVSSKRSRSSADLQALAGSAPAFVTRNGLHDRYACEEGLHVHDEVLEHGRPLMGSTVTGLPRFRS